MRIHTTIGTLLSCGLLLTACGSGGSELNQSAESATVAPVASVGSEHTSVGDSGPLPDAGAASCVESYSPEAVQDRGFALDGVVVDIGPSVSDRGNDGDLNLTGVTLEVQEWFVGGEGAEVEVDLQTIGDETAEQDLPFDVGTRLLVSGEPRWGGAPLDSPIAWGCGFSRYHDQATATAWRESAAQ